MINYGQIISANLKELMASKRLNQVGLSELSGQPQAVISRALKGAMNNPKIDTLEALASPFKKSAAWLLIDHSASTEVTPLEAWDIVGRALAKQLPAARKPELAAEYIEIIEALKARPLKIDEVRAALGITAAREASRSPAKKERS